MEKQKKMYDSIVVGTGPGGATVAKELSLRGKKVLMLEWGAYKPVTGKLFNTIPSLTIPGKNILFAKRLMAMVRAVTTGGSSVYYYGTAFSPPVDMFKKYGINISKELAETKKELPIKPLPDEWIGPLTSRIMESACELGYDWKKLDKFIYHEKLNKDIWSNWYCAPGFESKWNARMYVDEAVENGADILNHAKVSRIITENKKAVGVEFKKNGKVHRAYADNIILGAGGIGSPVILSNSGIKGAGYNFFFDPLIAVMGTVKDVKGGPEIPMSTGCHFTEDGYMMTDMYVPGELYLLNQLEGFRLNRLMSQRIMVKAKDSLGGCITKKGRVRKPLAPNDRHKLMHGYGRAKNILRNAGAKDIFRGWVLAAHPGGTVKIDHLVDKNLKTEYDNLYVCDCSVMPEAWGLPPTLSLVCLGKRLAKQLVK